ncbi:alpha/beta-hydrolase [Backusella circina FSU 941]|nr:alpha/beta-hydrolase [Backusella circina FSU 941]
MNGNWRRLAQHKLITVKKKEKKPPVPAESQLNIIYPARQPALCTDSFFTDPKVVVVEKSKRAKTDKLKKQSHAGPVTPQYRAPREPIVLCHGLFGFDIRGPDVPALQVHYWSGIEETLAKLGCRVIITKVPQAGSIWERSQALHTILKSIVTGKNAKINFVAHSMGGLDCRHLLANVKDRPYQVQSLTTICTPHRGSPVMDWFRDHVGVGVSSALVEKTLLGKTQADCISWPTSTTTMSTKKNTMRHEGDATLSLTCSKYTGLTNYTKVPTPSLKPALDKMVEWFDEPAYAHLTTDFCNDYFNPNTPDDPSVSYYSYGAAAQLPAWSSLLGLPWKLVYDKEGDNDGMVSIDSAKWGTYVKTIQADHWDLSGKSYVPYRLRTSKTDQGKEFDRYDFYAELATHLYQQGH